MSRHFYWRQLRDRKGSALVEAMTPLQLTFYAGVCEWTLARSLTARSGGSRDPRAGCCAPPTAVLGGLVTRPERTFHQDPLLAFRLLADIGMRALSSAVNDPSPAVGGGRCRPAR